MAIFGEETYEVIRSKRKTMSLSLKTDGSMLVRAGYGIPDEEIHRFLVKNYDWVLRQRSRKVFVPSAEKMSEVQKERLVHKAQTELVPRVRRYAREMGIRIGRVTIRIQKTRWGSCSGKGNLNFNALLMLAPQEVQDYVIIHELVHRLEMNHSDRFWLMVKYYDPNYESHRNWLKVHGNELMGKVF